MGFSLRGSKTNFLSDDYKIWIMRERLELLKYSISIALIKYFLIQLESLLFKYFWKAIGSCSLSFCTSTLCHAFLLQTNIGERNWKSSWKRQQNINTSIANHGNSIWRTFFLLRFTHMHASLFHNYPFRIMY